MELPSDYTAGHEGNERIYHYYNTILL